MVIFFSSMEVSVLLSSSDVLLILHNMSAMLHDVFFCMDIVIVLKGEVSRYWSRICVY